MPPPDGHQETNTDVVVGDFDRLLAEARDIATVPPDKASDRSKYLTLIRETAVDIVLEYGLREQGDLIWQPSEGLWYRLTNGRLPWSALSDEHMKVFVTMLLRALQGDVPTHRGSDRNDVLAELKAELTPSVASTIDKADYAKPWHLDTGVVMEGRVVKNGVLRIGDDGQDHLEPVDERVFIRTALPWTWSGLNHKCPPRFGDFLCKVLPDDGDRLAFVRIVGMMLMKESASSQGFMFLRGQGRSGKGTINRLIKSLFAKKNIMSVRGPEGLATKFDLADIANVDLVTLDDIKERPTRGIERDKFDSGLGTVKNLRGGDAVDSERKYGVKATVTPNVVLLLTSNYGLTFAQGAQDALSWSESAWIFHFAEAIPVDERIPDFEDKVLGPELEDIFTYCVSAYAYFKGCHRGIPTAPKMRSIAMDARSDELLDDAKGDAGVFFDKYVTILDSEADAIGQRVSRTELRSAMATHLKMKEGQRPGNSVMSNLYSLIESEGGRKTKYKSEWHYYIRLGAAGNDDF